MMKGKIILLGAAVLFAIGSLTFIGCGNAGDHSEEDGHDNAGLNEEHEHAEGEEHNGSAEENRHVFVCPMHPEITGVEGDHCSECGMDLEKVEHEHEE